MIFAGLDEAGYGPLLGPLVVSGAVFRVNGECAPEGPDLWKLLRKSTSRKPDDRRVAVADSKKLYSAQKGLRFLEEGALAFLHLLDGGVPAGFRDLLRRLSLDGDGPGDHYLDEYLWYRGRCMDIPVTSWRNQIHKSAQRLKDDLARSCVEFLGIRAVPIEVIEFNRRLEETRNKAHVSFHAVGSILSWIWREFPEEDIVVQVDRQGGRMRYGPLLYQKIRPRGIRVGVETEEVSSYELLRNGSTLKVTFAVEGEGKWFPVALASMYCKYVRELHMSIFNRFWLERMPALRSTAGYFADGSRFLEDISAVRRELAVDDAALVRKR
jgi:hypothetical protein